MPESLLRSFFKLGQALLAQFCAHLKGSGCTQDDDVQFSQDSAVLCCASLPSLDTGDLLCLVVRWTREETLTPQSLVLPAVAHSSCAAGLDLQPPCLSGANGLG